MANPEQSSNPEIADDSTTTASQNLGSRLRAARESRRISLREMARRIGVSPSFVSQVERGKANPSVVTLYAFVSELGASLDELMGDSTIEASQQAPQETSTPLEPGLAWDPQTTTWPRVGIPVQRSNNRSRIVMSGVVWERLTPEDDSFVDFLQVEYAPGSSSCRDDDMMRHGGREYGTILSGRINVQVGFEEYELGVGDSIHFDSATPHRLSNPYDEPCSAIWIVVARRQDNRVFKPVVMSNHLPGMP